MSKFPVISSISLVAVNALPLYGVMYRGWELFSILFVYWMESFVIGIFTILKIKMAARKNDRSSFSITSFFILHYGMFMMSHLIFIFVFFWPPTLSFFDALFVLTSLFASHGISYVINFLGQKEYQRTTADKQMFAPYGRIFVMHFTVIMGGGIIKSLGAPSGALFIMVAVKTVIDLFSHLSEHNKLGTVL